MVLPEPVGATAMTSFPSSIAGMDFCCIAVAVCSPDELSFARSGADNPKESNVINTIIYFAKVTVL
jgi:hypothetical protein